MQLKTEIEKRRRKHGEVEMDTHILVCTSEDRKCNPSPCPLCSPHMNTPRTHTQSE